MNRKRVAGFIATAVLAAAACSGGADEPSADDDAPAADDVPATDDQDSTGEESGETDGSEVPSDEPAAFPVDGPVVTVLDFGLGVFAIDRNDGSSAEFTFPGDDGDDVWFADRQRQPVVVGDSAYSVFSRELADLEFVNEFALGELDLVTGTASLVTEFGPAAESAEAAERSSWELHGAGGGVAWLTRVDTGDAVTSTLFSVDLATGERLTESTDVEFELTNASGDTCTFGVRPIGVDSNGTLIIGLGGVPAEWDPAAGSANEIVPACANEGLVLTEVADDPAEFTITPDGSPLDDEAAERIFDADVTARNTDDMLITDDSVWWVFVGVRSYLPPEGGQVDAMVGGLARLDRATGEIEAVALGDSIGEFVEQNDDGGWTTTLLSGALTEAGGSVWVMDTRDNGELIKVDPATGAVATTEIPLDPVGVDAEPDTGDGPRGTTGVGSRYTTAELLATDPDGVWLLVTRWTIIEEEDGTSASGQSYVDQVDPVTGEVVRSIPEGDLTGVSF